MINNSHAKRHSLLETNILLGSHSVHFAELCRSSCIMCRDLGKCFAFFNCMKFCIGRISRKESAFLLLQSHCIEKQTSVIQRKNILRIYWQTHEANFKMQMRSGGMPRASCQPYQISGTDH